MSADIEVRNIAVWMCTLCIAGKGGECHSPGCVLFMRRAPDLPLHPELIEDATALRASRAAALTEEEREALRAVADRWSARQPNHLTGHERRALATLDRLLGGKVVR